jgi:hypothetical protein
MKAVALALALAAVIVLAGSYAAAGQAGLLVLAGLAGVAALLAARLRIPGPPPPAGTSRRPARLPNPEFPGYRRIHVALSEARVSGRLFDLLTRPLLQRLLAALLADRRRTDISKNPQAAREAMGGDLWPLLDPSRPATQDSSAPGVSLETLTAIVDRLEDV